MSKIIGISGLIMFAVIQPAFAYIDPGSGSAIMSLIIGFFVAAGVLAKTFWYKIMGILGLSSSNKEDNPAENGDNISDRRD